MPIRLFEPYHLPKRYRHEEYQYINTRRKRKWTKNWLDLDEETVLGRTCFDWGKLLIFYICFYTGVALFFALCYTIFQSILDEETPSVKPPQPSFCFEPVVESIDQLRCICFRENRDHEVEPYYRKIHKFLGKYGDVPSRYTGCTESDMYGYTTRSPCVFLKINRVIGFEPETYNNHYQLPPEVPQDLKDYIQNLPTQDRMGHVWITCKSNPQVQIDIVPFPFVLAKSLQMDKKTYNSPNEDVEEKKFFGPEDYDRIVAAKFTNLALDQKVDVHCYMWAKNIEHKETTLMSEMGQGVVHFQLKISQG